jgi:hypothetical protein
MSKTNKETLIHKLYIKWCEETKRNGAILVGGSIREFFDWLDKNNFKLINEKLDN